MSDIFVFIGLIVLAALTVAGWYVGRILQKAFDLKFERDREQ